MSKNGQSVGDDGDYRDRPCARCGAEDPLYKSPEWNLCSNCNNRLHERYGNV